MKKIITIGIIVMFSCMALITIGTSTKVSVPSKLNTGDNDFEELEIQINSANILTKTRYSLHIINPSPSITYYFTYEFKINTVGLGEVDSFKSGEKTLGWDDATSIIGLCGQNANKGFGFCSATLSISGYGQDEGKNREVTSNGIMLGQFFYFLKTDS